MNDLIIISLDMGFHAIIDVADAPLVLPYEWRVSATQRRDGTSSYVVFGIVPGFSSIGLHRYLLGDPPGVLVDHHNQNGLDCRRCNLRRATKAQNCSNRKKFNFRNGSKSQFKGIIRYGKTNWYAQIYCNYQLHKAGPFPTEEDAARGYDDLARKYHGEFASLNFPDAQDDAA